MVSGAGAAAAEAEAEAQEAGCVEAAAAEDEVDRDGGSDEGLGSDGSEAEGEGASEAEGEEGSEDEGVGGAAARLLCEQLSLADIVLLNKQAACVVLKLMWLAPFGLGLGYVALALTQGPGGRRGAGGSLALTLALTL